MIIVWLLVLLASTATLFLFLEAVQAIRSYDRDRRRPMMAAFTSYTLDQYRRLPDPIRREKWAGTANPHRPFYTDRGGWPILLIGIHITAGLDDYAHPDDSAEATTSWGRTTSGASWHACVDSDSIVPFLPDTYVAWVQGVPGYNFNRPGLGLEIGARSTDWASKPAQHVARILRTAAAWCAPRVIQYGIPLRVLRDRDEVQRLINRRTPVGFVAHHVLSPETRSDPGLYRGRDTFPWPQFLQYVAEEVALRKGAPLPPRTTLMRGDVGDDVRDLQTLLNKTGAALDVDGDFGPDTETAVRVFQKAAGLDVDGIAGPATLTALRKPHPPTTGDLDMDEKTLRRIIREEIDRIDTARSVWTRHSIVKSNPDDTEPRVTPSTLLEDLAFGDQS